MARVTRRLSKRVQTQAQLGCDIAAALQAHLDCDGVAVVLQASHMGHSGPCVEQRTTACVGGSFREEGMHQLQVSRQSYTFYMYCSIFKSHLTLHVIWCNHCMPGPFPGLSIPGAYPAPACSHITFCHAVNMHHRDAGTETLGFDRQEDWQHTFCCEEHSSIAWLHPASCTQKIGSHSLSTLWDPLKTVWNVFSTSAFA